MIRKSCYAGTSPRLGRYGGDSPMLTNCNCLAVPEFNPPQPAAGAGWVHMTLLRRQEPASIRLGARRK